MQKITLGVSELNVTPICLGTMTFGEQVSEPVAHDVISRAVDSGINFIDTAEMYAVPARKETFGATETIIGNWFERHPGMRQKLVLASKVAGPSRGMPWIREGSGMTAQDILNACDASLKRLKTDVIDLYQIHWPERHVPSFGVMYFDPSKAAIETSLHEQLLALEKLVKAGKVRVLAVSSEKRVPMYPDIPTLEEIAPGVQAVSWVGISAPAQTPKAITSRLEKEILAVLNTPDMQARLSEPALGLFPLTLGSDKFSEFIQKEIRTWSPVIKAGNIRVD